MGIIDRLLPAVLAAGLAAPAAAMAADARSGLSVDMDHARILKVPRRAAMVIVGNPAIADVAVQDATTMVLTGRSYGTTNLIVLDEGGKPIIDEQVVVRNAEIGTVRIYRQAARQTFACTPECEPTVTIGDTPTDFALAADQIRERQKLAIEPTQGKE